MLAASLQLRRNAAHLSPFFLSLSSFAVKRRRGIHVGARASTTTTTSTSSRRRIQTSGSVGKNELELEEKPFYVTAPLFYPNAAPHIGHLHSLVIADVLACSAFLRGGGKKKVEFVTGSDEHGLKIQQVAAKEGCSEESIVERGAKRFVKLGEKANISLTRFVRTSAEEGHRRGVVHLWNELQTRGLLYKGTHAGWYAVADECFYTEAQTRLVPASLGPGSHLRGVEENVREEDEDEKMIRIATETGARVEWTEEENWKFRLSAFGERLRERYEGDNLAIHPPHQHTSVLSSLSSLSSPLEDLSVSRPTSRLHWGIRVPGDESTQTMYVWVDALMGYLTGVGFPAWVKDETGLRMVVVDGGGRREGGGMEGGGGEGRGERCAWPPDVQVIGKDIVRFHAIHLTAFLMALDLPLPRRLYAHAHWTVSRAKMSKSVGNVVDPMEVMKEHGVDVVRWYIVRVGGNGRGDVDWSTSQLEKHELELSGLLGNLLSRVSSKKILNAIPSADRHLVRDPAYLQAWTIPPEDREMKIGRRREAWKAIGELRDALLVLESRVVVALDRLEIGEAVQEIVQVLKMANKAYTEAVPWASSSPPGLRLAACAWAVETLRIAGILLQPFIPSKADELLFALGVSKAYRAFEFARVGRGQTYVEGEGEGRIRSGVVLFPSKEMRMKKGVERGVRGEVAR